jgi:hypothetical protein
MGHYDQATCRGPVPVAAGNRRSAPVVFREKAEKTRLDPVSLWTRSLKRPWQGNKRKIEEDEMLESFICTLVMYGAVMAAAWIFSLVSPR